MPPPGAVVIYAGFYRRHKSASFFNATACAVLTLVSTGGTQLSFFNATALCRGIFRFEVKKAKQKGDASVLETSVTIHGTKAVAFKIRNPGTSWNIRTRPWHLQCPADGLYRSQRSDPRVHKVVAFATCIIVCVSYSGPHCLDQKMAIRCYCLVQPSWSEPVSRL